MSYVHQCMMLMLETRHGQRDLEISIQHPAGTIVTIERHKARLSVRRSEMVVPGKPRAGFGAIIQLEVGSQTQKEPHHVLVVITTASL
jgi:hypothetical protein